MCALASLHVKIPLFLYVSWVMLQNLFSQMRAVYMHIDFRCADVFVPEHGLDGSEVGSPLQQMGGKTVSESMRTDVLGYSSQ